MADRCRQVVWTDHALSALDEILGYIAQNSPRAATVVLEAVVDAADRLTTLPERGRIVPEIDEPSVREVFVYRYRLVYEVRDDEVSILVVLHGARDFAKWREGR